MPGADTKTRILDAAERLFAARGVDATSLREVTRSAAVNLAAVHYHFGSKQGLLRAAFERRIGPVNSARLLRLDALESRWSDRAASTEELLEAFLAPALALARSNDPGSRAFLRLVGRLNAESGAHGEWLMEVFAELERRFVPAFQRALPHLDAATLSWRVHFLIGTLCVALADPDRLVRMSRGLCDPRDGDALLRQLVAFSAAGFLAAPPAPPGDGALSDARATQEKAVAASGSLGKREQP